MKPASAKEHRAPARGFLRGGAVRGRLSLVTFFARAKKVTRPTGAERKISGLYHFLQAKPATDRRVGTLRFATLRFLSS